AGGMITVTGNSVISGDQGLHLLGRVTLQGVNTYTGNTTIGINGNLTIANDQAIPNGAGKGNVVMDDVDSGAPVLNLNGNDLNINGLSGVAGASNARVMNNGGGAKELIRGHGDASADFHGIIIDRTGGSGTVWLGKVGTGTQTLSDVNTYTGKTRIHGGTLKLGAAGSIANSSAIEIFSDATFDVSEVAGGFTLASGRTLAGDGGVLGAATIAEGAVLAPGGSIGTLSFDSTLTLAGETRMEIAKAGTLLTADLIEGVTTLTYGGTLTVTADGDPIAAGDSWTLFDADSFVGAFDTLNLPELSGSLTWNTSRLTVDGTIVAIPEPGVMVLLFGSLFFTIVWRRRR
ncbi:MAG TPA: hypothetical protein DD670_16305, partial [Planctomycetaceae bacterium]|nr:hypothetical protein [Planctomycetaceae bacterium]